MIIKEVFDKAENGTLTYEEFVELAKGAKFEDINEGKYYSKNKHNDEISAKDKEIETLQNTITQRDTDLADLQQKLTAAGTDAEKLTALTGDFTNLQTKYDTDIKAYKEQLKKQAYEFAVKDFANSKKFTSNAAKRDFIQSMIAKELKMDSGVILGAEDFVTTYSANNADAFVTETKEPEPTPAKPTFVSPTQGGNPSPVESNAFAEAFNFMGVRPHDE